MPGFFTLEWRDGREEEHFGHRGYYYVLSETEILPFLPDPAWCRDCRKMTLCESAISSDAVRAELAEMDDPRSDISKQLARSEVPGFTERWRSKKELELKHAQSRNLAPSCMSCGGRDVFHFPDNEWVAHPETGEGVRLSGTGMCSTDFAMKFFDVDANPLDLDESERSRLLEIVNARETT